MGDAGVGFGHFTETGPSFLQRQVAMHTIILIGRKDLSDLLLSTAGALQFKFGTQAGKFVQNTYVLYVLIFKCLASFSQKKILWRMDFLCESPWL